ncbi:MAG: energy-coupling factor ABC transporter ATP-binding protein [Ignavibacteria bacterium]|nr:energy-coupling factor ABC transporter ATP-binding protein [Ignavibacteria bacterium]
MNDKKILYDLRNVSYYYLKEIIALEDITLTINENSIFAFIGVNGCGKSTLMHILNGLLYPNQGNVIYKGEELNEVKFKNIDFVRKFRTTNTLVFQDTDSQLFCSDVYSELSFGLIQTEISDKEIKERVEQVAELMKISSLLNRAISSLSGGEKKKVAIASALILNPEVILLDEPTSELDPKTQGLIVEIIYELKKTGKTIIISTHDLGLIDDLKPDLCVLNEQHKVEIIGRAEDILENEEILLKVNLIHEHTHLHNGMMHKHIHSHYKIHKH